MVRSGYKIPYQLPLPAPTIIPRFANTLGGATTALANFLLALPSPLLPTHQRLRYPDKTVVLTGAGLSVSSGLADYRGKAGSYTLNPSYVPVVSHEFGHHHASRQRYWARSFLGWPAVAAAQPNAGHKALAQLGQLGLVSQTITQNVDGLQAGPDTIELHGYLRHVVCRACGTEHPRAAFQDDLARLNPDWAALLAELTASGALRTEDPAERAARGLHTRSDGDVDVPGARYDTFRYPPCPTCLANNPGAQVRVDADGAFVPPPGRLANGADPPSAGILKPAVVMFGESVPAATKAAVEQAIDDASRLLIVGTTLSTYSAVRIVKRAFDRSMPIALLNLGGTRADDLFFGVVRENWLNQGDMGVRAAQDIDEVLPLVVEAIRART